MKNELLRVEHLDKIHNGVQILDDLSFSLYEGEILGLTGLNHSGKTTLANILNGICTPDCGTIWVNGEKVQIFSTKSARNLGIYGIGQEPDLIPDQTVSENLALCLGKSPKSFIIHKKENLLNAQGILHKMELSINARTKCRSLTDAQQHLIQIVKGFLFQSRVLIIDNVTSLYSEKELAVFFDLLHLVQKKRVAIIFISQKTHQLFSVSTRILVMRKGTIAGTLFPEEYTAKTLSALMTGQPQPALFLCRPAHEKKEVFRIEHLYTSSLSNINFSLEKGEILGVNASVSSDTPSLMRVFTNRERPLSGSIFIEGRKLKKLTPREFAANRIGVIPFSLMRPNLFLNLTVLENLNLLQLKRLRNAIGLVSSRIERYTVQEFSKNLSLSEQQLYSKVRDLQLSPEQEIAILLERWRCVSPRVLLLSGISRDLDAIALRRIWSRLEHFSFQHTSIILLSTDSSDLLTQCDRVITLEEEPIL